MIDHNALQFFPPGLYFLLKFCQKKKMQIEIQNPAYRRQWISQPIRIVSPVPPYIFFWRSNFFCFIEGILKILVGFPKKNIYINFYCCHNFFWGGLKKFGRVPTFFFAGPNFLFLKQNKKLKKNGWGVWGGGVQWEAWNWLCDLTANERPWPMGQIQWKLKKINVFSEEM